MTEQSENTGQISVAELLARNGQQVESRGGRRRRGAAGGISVAELTGELPVVTEGTPPIRNRRAAPDPDDDASLPAVAAVTAEPVAAKVVTSQAPSVSAAPQAAAVPDPIPAPALPTAPDVEPAVDHTQAIPALRRAVLAKADADRKAAADRDKEPPAKATPAPAATPVAEVSAAPVPKATPPSAKPSTPAAAKPSTLPVQVPSTDAQTRAAAAVTPAEKTAIVDTESAVEKTTVVGTGARPQPPATAPAVSLRPPTGSKAKTFNGTPDVREPALLTGYSLEADLERQARSARDESLDEARALVHTTGEFPRIVDTEDDGDAADRAGDATDAAADTAQSDAGATSSRSAVRQWAVLAGQAVVAIVAGALLFKGFEKLWDSLPWVALVLAVLVIAGLVAVVRILRQTEDLLSLLIAVIVGVFVTIGPLVFVLSSS